MDTTQPCDIQLRLTQGRSVGMWINKNIFNWKGQLQEQQKFENLRPSTPLVSFQWPNLQQPAQVTTLWTPVISGLKHNRLRDFAESTVENMGMDCWEVVKLVAERCLERFDTYLLEVTFWGIKLGHRQSSSAPEFMDKRRSEVTSTLIELLADTEFLFVDVLVDWKVEVDNKSHGNHFALPAPEVSLPSRSTLSRLLPSGQTSSLALDGPTSSIKTPGSSESEQEYNWERVGEKAMFVRLLKKMDWMKDTMENLSEKMDRNSVEIIQRLTRKIDDYQGNQQYSSSPTLVLQDPALVDRNQLNLGESDQDSMEQDTSLVQADFEQGTASFRAITAQQAASNRNPRREAVPSSSAKVGNSPQPTPRPDRQENSSAKHSVAQNSTRSSYAESQNNLKNQQSSLESIRRVEPGGSGRDRQRTPPTIRNQPTNMTNEPHTTSTDRSTANPTSHHRPPDRLKSSSSNLNRPVSPQPNFSASYRPDSTKSVSGDKFTVTGYESSQLEANLVKESVEKAQADDTVKAPKAKSFDTMLCLDISESMKEGGAFEQMKETVKKFIDGVDENIINTGVEENMGLVAFGGRANVLQNLTNDLSLIRDKIDDLEPEGNSPFLEALLVSMAAFVKKGGVVSISGEWEVKPRIIFFSDGYPTESTQYGTTDIDQPMNSMSIRMSLMKLLNSFNSNEHYNKVHPVVFVPVGQKADVSYMETMAKICSGVLVKPENIMDMCYYFRIQETIGKVLVCLRREKGDDKLEATIQALTPELSEEHRTTVREAIEKELADPNRNRSRSTKPNDLEYFFEDTAKVNEGERLPLGTRVVRGPDWEYDDQDRGAAGTVINHHERRSIHWVQWDNADYNRYHYSKHHGYHIWKAENQPRLRKGDEPLEIGMTVKKGPDWSTADAKPDQDVDIGVIIRKSREKKKVVVRWENGAIQVCRWSPTGPADVEYCDPTQNQHEQRKPSPTNQQAKASSSLEDAPETFSGSGRWQWRDTNNEWKFYSPQINAEIEAACKKKNSRSCVIERDNKQRRVMFRFKKKVEKIIDSGAEYEIRRLQFG